MALQEVFLYFITVGLVEGMFKDLFGQLTGQGSGTVTKHSSYTVKHLHVGALELPHFALIYLFFSSLSVASCKSKINPTKPQGSVLHF